MSAGFSYVLMKQGEIKELIFKLEKYYNTDLSELKKYYFYLNNKGKVHISKINLNSLNLERVNTIGLYFGTIHDENRFRLSIEGSKFINPNQNYIELNEKSLNTYLSGENLFKDEVKEINFKENCPFLIVRYNKENLGCMNVKETMLMTYLSKSRKLDFNKLF